MIKIITFREAIKFTLNAKRSGKTVGLITGCFDILHLGHINLFHFAKKHADILLVGIDSDSIVKATKGINRPVNNYFRRSRFLAELSSIDRVFMISGKFKHGDKRSFIVLKKIYSKIRPTHVITSKACDNLLKEKTILAKELGIISSIDKSKKVTNSSSIIKIIESEM